MSPNSDKKEPTKNREAKYEFQGGRKTVLKKIQSLGLMRDSSMNIAHICKQLGIHRRSFFRWKVKDPEFERACHEIQEEIYDDAESMLQQKIHQDRDTISLIFFLKTKCKHRGYVEKQEIEHTTGKKFDVQITRVDNGDNKDQDKPEQKAGSGMADSSRQDSH